MGGSEEPLVDTILMIFMLAWQNFQQILIGVILATYAASFIAGIFRFHQQFTQLFFLDYPCRIHIFPP